MDEGFENFYRNKEDKNFQIVFVIISGKLYGRYIKKILTKQLIFLLLIFSLFPILKNYY